MIQSRSAAPTVKFVDEDCQWYKSLFSDVRNFEAFKYLHVGCVSDIKRKTLPAMPAASFANAKIVGLDNHQGLHHLLTSAHWEVDKLRTLGGMMARAGRIFLIISV